MKVKKGDKVLIIAGKDKGRTGKIIKSLLKEGTVLVEGINLKKKHIKAKKQGERGQVISAPAPISVSNVKIICPKCGKAVRIAYDIEKGEKRRICKKCKSQI
ncbi:MAG: 50S ribosomal protein L24 [Candidatus Staskawiczbacteria bacterium]|nr:50S ribosomal protein L24 [Candidatus Staskawiczbacteria bacterium]